MKFLATVALLATTALAAPADKLFNLKTSGASNSTHNDLYLSVGRGVVPDPLNSEAVFAGAAANRAATFYFANSTIYWSASSTSAPYALDLINVDGKPLESYKQKNTSNEIRCPQGTRPNQRRPHNRLKGLLHHTRRREGTQLDLGRMVV